MRYAHLDSVELVAILGTRVRLGNARGNWFNIQPQGRLVTQDDLKASAQLAHRRRNGMLCF